MERLDSAYCALGVLPGATVDEIRKEWKRLSIQNHLDKVGLEGNARMSEINNAFDVLMNELQSHELLAQQQKQNPKRRYSGLSPFDRAGHKKLKSRAPPRSAPPPKSSKPWPHRKILTRPPPPTSLPDLLPHATNTSLNSLLQKHNTHIAHLLDLQVFAESIHDWIKG